MLEGYPPRDPSGGYSIAAYSEFMPSPFVGRKPLGEIDEELFTDDDPLRWNITEMEEEYELRPGLEEAGRQIMDNIIRLGKGIPENHIHGHDGENLRNNPYWPPELSSRAGSLNHERFVALLPVMLSRTQDDKGRVTWTFFGCSTLGPETAFWKNFLLVPAEENAEDLFVSFFSDLMSDAYSEKCSGRESLFQSGFRILQSENTLPEWAEQFTVKDDPFPPDTKYLLTFRPFTALPIAAKDLYFSGKLSLLPFPGSLVFWGMPGYKKLKEKFPLGGQIPLLNLVGRSRGIGGLRVNPSGWFLEPGPGAEYAFNPRLLHEEFHRTHRWQRLHRYQDELNEAGSKASVVKVLFSTEPDAIGLYDKPMARNSQIWTSKYELLLDGPHAERREILKAEKTIIEGGLFGYRFFYPPMRVGDHEIYLHRTLTAWLDPRSDRPQVRADRLKGYITGYHMSDREMVNPVEMVPFPMKRESYISAIRDFHNESDHYLHQTSLNIISLLEAWHLHGMKLLSRSFARSLLNISKEKKLEEWLEELSVQSAGDPTVSKMKEVLSGILEPDYSSDLPEAITFAETASRKFEEEWWNDIRYLAHGEFINKDNADVAQDITTQTIIKRHQRDLESLGDYLIARHRKAISEAGMNEMALCGELPFKWSTDFDFQVFGGWRGNQRDETHERNILVVIPGKNRKQAIVLADHYDTAYMEDIYEKERGGSGARLSANGADDNYSATSTILQAAPIYLRLAKQGRLERDIWLLHLTGEEFPSDCLGARNFCQNLVRKNVRLKTDQDTIVDLSETTIEGVFIMDMIGHNRDNDQDIFQISPGGGEASLNLAWQAHLANRIWNESIVNWNKMPERQHLGRGKRVAGLEQIPATAEFLHIDGEVRTGFNPHSSLYNTDGQIFSDTGVPVVLFMENYDINRTGYHDTKDTLENIDLDYGAAFASIAIETVARVATL